MKLFAWLIAAALILGVLGVATPALVHAQPVPTAERPPGQGDAPHAIVTKTHPHDDIVESHGKGMALLFWAFAAASIAGALFVVTRRNLIAAVMGMVGSFIGIAAVYMMLYAQFLAVIQMLVYAGAIMVLFVFVIMILNRPEDELVAPTGRIGQVVGGLAIIYLVGRLAMILVHVTLPNKVLALASPAPIVLPGWGSAGPETVGWGTVKAVGNDLFNSGLFPFEAISILLLVAVVGAIAIARPLHPEDGTDADPGIHP
ncbi:MAG TPA: NADH-quinone oxidoreductase subunit J [Kofleriaceae bacterium]|nr:NADH-quinone oxidoreductase subunit J [Kofleriaceae bacterium]